MNYDELMKSLGERMGGVRLLPDDEGCVALDVDGMPLTIMGLDELRQVALTGEIGEPPPADRMERLYHALLVANHNLVGTRGATISINPETGRLSLCRLFPLDSIDVDAFSAGVEQFVNTLETWRRIVDDFHGAEIKPEGGGKVDDAGADFEFGGGLAGLMKV